MERHWHLFAKHLSAKQQRPDRFLLRLWHAQDQGDTYRRTADREFTVLHAAAVEELIRLFDEPWATGKQLFDDDGEMRVEPEDRTPDDTKEVLIYRFLGRMVTGLSSASLWLIGPEPDDLDALLAPWVERHAAPEAAHRNAAG